MDLDPRPRHDSATNEKITANGSASSVSPTSPGRLSQLSGRPFLEALGAQGGQRHHSKDEENGSEHDQDHSNGELESGSGDPFDPKKIRACEGCRGLKVRCEPDPDGEGPCKRCKKASRKCVVTMPTGKRQKKTDSRVAELEKKIDALTASLQARVPNSMHAYGQQTSEVGAASAPGSMSHAIARGSPTTSSSTPLTGQRSYAPGDDSSIGGPGAGWGGQPPRRWNAATPPIGQQPTYDSAREHMSRIPPPVAVAGQKRRALDRPDLDDDRRESPIGETTPSLFARPAEGDIVDRGIITTDFAVEIFARYNEQMVPHMPSVFFPPATTAADIRKSKPILFLSIMAAASVEYPKLQKTLQRELMYVFAEKIFILGEKRIELIQAIHVSVIWYWPPEHFEELKFYQLIHIAAVMAIDIGLGKNAMLRHNAPIGWNEGPWRRQPPPDPRTIESRRVWLTCHFLCSNTSMAMHRPNLLRWTPFMTESLEMLQTSPEAAPTDQYFCHLVWSHRHAEEVGLQFSMDDSSNGVNLTELRTQHSLKSLQRDLDKYRASIPAELMQPTLEIGFHVVSLFMNELAIQSGSSITQCRPPFTTDNIQEGIVQSETLSSAHINALSACLAASTGILDVFLSLPVPRVRYLPVYNFVRVAFALVILLKMYFSASSPKQDLGSIIDRESLRAEHYVEALIAKFREAAVDEQCRPAMKFLVVLAMLKTWFLKHGKGDTASGKTAAGLGQAGADMSPQRSASSSGDGVARQQPNQANTPLHLLSEVATVRDSRAARTSMFNKGPGMPQSHQTSFSDGTPSAEPSPASRDLNHQSLPGLSLPPPAPRNESVSKTDNMNAPSGTPVTGFSSASWMGPQVTPTAAVASDLVSSMDLSNITGFEGAGLGGDMVEASINTFPMFFMNEAWFDFDSMMMQNLPDPNLFPF